MKRKAKYMALVLLIALVAAALTACTEKVEKHPLVAKWTEQFDEGRTQVTFSFEAIGDAEVYLWRYDDEAGKLVQTEYYWGDYTVDDEGGTVLLQLENDDKEHAEATFAYATDGETLTLKNDDYDLTLKRAAENSAKVR